jgi:eukaryotic-like serine/threonine-protein kinase
MSADAARHRRLMDLFDEICDLEESERAARLAALRAEDPALAEDLERLLSADKATVRNQGLELGAAALLQGGSAPPATPRQPERVGRYRIVGVLGRGGMGVVYEAEQDMPRRRVAVKVVRAEVHSASLQRRFAFETQALGRLSHPGISRIYEAGIDAELCFFAMEHVPGRPITEHARRLQLTVAARVEILARVCEAVHHAHLRGVIHCDLKPANILVGDDGAPKVLDFGVARIIDPEGLLTVNTASGLIAGTPAYMSPEQTELTTEGLDARTDVYSLGVIAWELLAGRLPHDVKGKAVPEILRLVREADPRPLGRVVPELRGDVETIVGKALAREPDRRYQSAQALADDLRRFLAHEPIAARPPTLGYQLQKFARRNRALVVALAGLAAVLLASVVVTAALLVRTERARAALRRVLDDQTIAFARGMLSRDPTATLARLKTLSQDANWDDALAVGREAMARGASSEVLGRHPGEVHTAVFDGAGGVLSASFDGTVHEWDLAQHRASTLHIDGEVRWIAAGRGDAWAAGTAQGTLCFGHGAATPEVVRGGAGAMEMGAYSHDLATLATAGGDGAIRFWPSGRALTGHEGAVAFVAWSPEDARLASIGIDGTVRLWDVAAGTGRVLGRHLDEGEDVAWSPDGAAILSVGRDGRAMLWDLGDDSVRLLDDHADELKTVAFGAPGVAAWGSRDGRVHLWADGAVRVVGAHDGVVRTLAFAPGGKVLASGGDDRLVRVFWVATGAMAELRGHDAWVRALHFSDDGTRILSASDDGTARVWPLPGPAEPGARRVAFSPNGALLAVGDADKAVRVGTVGPLGWSDEPRIFAGHTDEVYRVAFSPDGKLLASAGRDKTVRVLDLATGSAVTLPLAARAPKLAVGPGHRLAAATPQSTATMWNLDTGGQLLLSGHEGRVRDLAFLPDGRLVTASEDRTLRLWSADGITARVFSGAAGGLFLVAATPDGRHVAAGGDDGVVHVWEVDGEGHESYPAHDGVVTALAYDDGGVTLASGGADRTVALRRGPSVRRLGPVGGAITAVVFAADQVIAGAADGATHAWPAAGGPGRVLSFGHSPVLGLAASTERGLVATASDSEGLRVAPLEPVDGPAAVRAILEGATHAVVGTDGGLESGFGGR